MLGRLLKLLISLLRRQPPPLTPLPQSPPPAAEAAPAVPPPPAKARPVVGARAVSPSGLALIKRWEGLRLEAYVCPAGVWTVGFGATGPDIKEGTVWTLAKADEDLKTRCAVLAYRICSKADDHKVQLTQGQLDALVSFAYNLGLDALFSSTLWHRLMEGQPEAASLEFMKWVYVKSKPVTGLVARRREEQVVFRA